MMRELLGAAQGVRDALNNLLQKVKFGGRPERGDGKYDETCDNILGATERLFNSMGNAGEMVRQAKILAMVSAVFADLATPWFCSESRRLAYISHFYGNILW